jgi:hypothetical protein
MAVQQALLAPMESQVAKARPVTGCRTVWTSSSRLWQAVASLPWKLAKAELGVGPRRVQEGGGTTGLTGQEVAQNVCLERGPHKGECKELGRKQGRRDLWREIMLRKTSKVEFHPHQSRKMASIYLSKNFQPNWAPGWLKPVILATWEVEIKRITV